MPAPVVYISGPISAPHMKDVVRNMSKFYRAEMVLMEYGCAPINPAADIIALMQCPEYILDDDERWWSMLMGKDEALVKRSDGLYLLPGWEQSKGAVQEKEWADEALIVSSVDIVTLLLSLGIACDYAMGGLLDPFRGLR